MARRAVERDDTPKYEPSIYNYKCSEDSSGSRSPTPSKEEQPPIETFGKDTTANTQKSPHGDGEHSDNCSEVSDEGYRSLGAVQSSTANGNSTSTQSSPTVADCQSKWTSYIYIPDADYAWNLNGIHKLKYCLIQIDRFRFERKIDEKFATTSIVHRVDIVTY